MSSLLLFHLFFIKFIISPNSSSSSLLINIFNTLGYLSVKLNMKSSLFIDYYWKLQIEVKDYNQVIITGLKNCLLYTIVE